jgi:cell wall-associated NlpC family hydrolase
VTSRPIDARTSRVRVLLRQAVLGAATLALAGSLLSGPGVSPAAADPPLTAAEAKVQVDQLEMDASAIDQEAVGVKENLATGKKRLALKQEDVRQQTAKVSRLRKQVGQVALAQFQNHNLDTTAQLLLDSDTDGFLDKMATVEKVSENQNTLLQDYQASQARLAELARSAKVDVATLQTEDQELARLRAASAAKITESKAVLARLTKEERERIAAEERAARAAAQKAADAAAAAQRAKDVEAAAAAAAAARAKVEQSKTEDTPAPEVSDDGSAKGAVALAYARKQLGLPYSFGAAGPSAFDCSGLTLQAWKAAGVSIPRTSLAQSTGGGRPVNRSELRPGDLVFFFSPVSHVALYAGDGMIIHAPRPGKSVQYIKMSAMEYAGARRPG